MTQINCNNRLEVLNIINGLDKLNISYKENEEGVFISSEESKKLTAYQGSYRDRRKGKDVHVFYTYNLIGGRQINEEITRVKKLKL